MRNKLKTVLGIAGAATVLALGSATPASAAASGVTFWSGWFTGQSVTYPNPSTSCTTLPFAARSELNETSKTLLLYTTTDCTGPAITIPATDVHNFTTDIRSFRAAG